ncbi:MAG TPA: hypothetical protein VMB18_15430 [Terriglobales bacterium]|nr:hypothetical protein [Terriglobales bacterium]
MRYRVARWAAGGFLVTAFWALYAFPTFVPTTSAEMLLYTLARFTQPIVAVGAHLHVGIRVYWVLLANVATYAVAGLIVESLATKIRSCGLT